MATQAEFVKRYPENSMKSTWRRSDKRTWNHQQRVYDILKLHPTDLDREVPKHAKTDKIPYLSHLEGHKWIIAHAAWPLLAHALFSYVTGMDVPLVVALAFYVFAYKANAIHEIRRLRELGYQYGYLDGDKHDRDQVPDTKTKSVLYSLIATATTRPIVSVFVAYSASQNPLGTLSWYLPLEIGVYQIVLDFYFYWYHRSMHESETLWKFHKTHHLSKHPSPLLSLFSDQVQEVIDIIGIPIITYITMRAVGLPMGFADWWICQQYVVWTELWGHSGLRVVVTPPTTATPFLRLFNAELLTEDHDLHHRKGWKSSYNYGKQTLFWDRLFGTTLARIESVESNIDWDNPISLSLW